MSTRNIRALGASVLFVLMAACGGDDPTGPEGPGAGPVVSVTVQPDHALLVAGDTVRLEATPRNAFGQPVTGVKVTWVSEDMTVASVSTAGLVMAHGEGAAVVKAIVGEKWAVAAIAVTEEVEPGPGPGVVTSVEIEPNGATLSEGSVAQLTAIARDAEGHVVEGRFVHWTSSEPTIVEVGVLGAAAARRVGRATITARVDGAQTSVFVDVVADYAYDLVFDFSEDVGMAPRVHRLDINTAGAVPASFFADARIGQEAAISPDGTRIAVTVPTNGGSVIWVARIDGRDSVMVAKAPGFNEQPTWSPDGTRIAYRHWNIGAGEGADIWAVDADGRNAVNLTNDNVSANNDAPAWSSHPTGSRIVYSRISEGRAHLWTMKPDGSDRVQMTFGDVADVNAAWSPDGQRIVFERYFATTGSTGDLWHLDVVTKGTVRLIALPFGQFSPAYMPDGSLIAFSSQLDGVLQIFTVRPDGTGLAQRTWGLRNREHPAWIRR